MKIAIDTSPLYSGHKVRGIGFYLSHLINALQKYFPEHTYTFFQDKNELPSDTDIVHYPYFDPFSITFPFVKKYPTVVTVHDLIPLVFHTHFPIGIKGWLKWKTQQFMLKGVDTIITDSQSSKKDIRKYISMPHAKICVVPLAAGESFRVLPEHAVTKVVQKYNLPDRFALYVGDVTWNKNIPRIVAACLATDTPLVMVGKALSEENFDMKNAWNNDRVKLQQLVKGQKNIIRLGFLPSDDVIAIYNAATLFIMPSLYEGFGLPILEAMSCGCPVITARRGSLSEVAGDAAYYVDPEDIQSIQEGIKTLRDDKKLRKAFITKGFTQIKKFSWKQTAQETVHIYKSLLPNL